MDALAALVGPALRPPHGALMPARQPADAQVAAREAQPELRVRGGVAPRAREASVRPRFPLFSQPHGGYEGPEAVGPHTGRQSAVAPQGAKERASLVVAAAMWSQVLHSAVPKRKTCRLAAARP